MVKRNVSFLGGMELRLFSKPMAHNLTQEVNYHNLQRIIINYRKPITNFNRCVITDHISKEIDLVFICQM